MIRDTRQRLYETPVTVWTATAAELARDAEIDARRRRVRAELEEYLYGPNAKPFPREEFDRSRWDDDDFDIFDDET